MFLLIGARMENLTDMKKNEKIFKKTIDKLKIGAIIITQTETTQN